MTSIHKRAIFLSLLGIVPIVTAYRYTRLDPGLKQMVQSRAAVHRATSWRVQTHTLTWEADESLNCADATSRGRQQCGKGPITRWGDQMFRDRDSMLYYHAHFRKGEIRVVDNGESCRDWLELGENYRDPKTPQVVRISCIGEADDLPRKIVIWPGRRDEVTLDFSGWNSTTTSSYEFRELPH